MGENFNSDRWLQTHWRPMMAIAYMIVIVFDFVISPIAWSLIQAYFEGSVPQQWSPLTLMGGGLFHISMCAVLGVSALTRGQEKIERVRSGVQTEIEVAKTLSSEADAAKTVK